MHSASSGSGFGGADRRELANFGILQDDRKSPVQFRGSPGGSVFLFISGEILGCIPLLIMQQ